MEVSGGHLCLYILSKVEIWTGVTDALLTDSLTAGMHSPVLALGKIAALNRPSPKSFQDCLAPPQKCPKFYCYPGPPRGVCPCHAPPHPKKSSFAPPRFEAKNAAPCIPDSQDCSLLFDQFVLDFTINIVP